MKKASDILKEAAAVIEERGKLRDKDDGERSMGRAVEAYMALCGNVMENELHGWLFMICLKMARATAGKTHLDDLTDLCGYGALAAEYVSKEFSITPSSGCVFKDLNVDEIDEVRNEWTDRHKAMDELVRLSEELGLYDVPNRGNSIDKQGKNEVIFPIGNPVLGDLSKYANPYTGEVNIPKENDWVKWEGGECPVDPEQLVEVRVRAEDGDGKAPAGEWWWGRENFLTSYDIIAYRVVKDG